MAPGRRSGVELLRWFVEEAGEGLIALTQSEIRIV